MVLLNITQLKKHRAIFVTHQRGAFASIVVTRVIDMYVTHVVAFTGLQSLLFENPVVNSGV